MLTADCGGCNGNRWRLWRVRLQDLSDELGMRLIVCHSPPGTSRWNKIEHRLFSFITSNWKGQPLVTREAVVNLIAGTRAYRAGREGGLGPDQLPDERRSHRRRTRCREDQAG